MPSKKKKDPIRVASGKKSRNKGHSAERALCKSLQAWWGHTFSRTPLSGGWATNKEFNVSGDICCSDPEFPFCVESKFIKNFTLDNFLTTSSSHGLFAFWNQAKGQCPEGQYPLLVVRKNRCAPLAIMDFRTRDKLGVIYNTIELRKDNLELVVISLDYLFDNFTREEILKRLT